MRTIRGMFITTAMLTLSAIPALAVGTPGQTGGLTLSVQCAPDPAYIGQTVNCFISVSPDNDGDPVPTGTVFSTTDGAATQASQILDASGNATFSLTGLHAGDNTITVTYPGDGGPGSVPYNYGVNVTGSYTFTVLVPPVAGNGPVMFIGAGYRLIPRPAATTQTSPWYPSTYSDTGTQLVGAAAANVWSRNAALYATMSGSYDASVGEDYYSDCIWAGFGSGVIPASKLSISAGALASAYGTVYASFYVSFDSGVTWSMAWPGFYTYYIGENGQGIDTTTTNVPAGTELSRVRVHATVTPMLSGQNNASLLIYDIHIE